VAGEHHMEIPWRKDPATSSEAELDGPRTDLSGPREIRISRSQI
jgi:hypothetical protein